MVPANCIHIIKGYLTASVDALKNVGKLVSWVYYELQIQPQKSQSPEQISRDIQIRFYTQ